MNPPVATPQLLVAPVSRPRGLGLAAVALGIMLLPLNSTMIGIALPRIARSLNVDASLSAWLITAYLLATVIAQPTLGKLGDRVGHRRMFIAGALLFAFASFAASIWWNFAAVMAFRVLQAVSGAALTPSGAALLRNLYASHERGRAFGVYSAVLGATAATGPVLGGVLVSLADWPAIFYISVPVSLAAVALTLYAIPARLRDAPITRRQFDAWGATALGIALLGLLLGLLLGPRDGWRAPEVIGSFVVALVFAVLFVVQERQHPEPVVHLQFFRNVHFSAAVLSVFFQNMVMYSTLILMPQFLQIVQQRSATESGLMLALMSGTSALLAPLGGALSDWRGRRLPVVIGAALGLIGVTMQALLQTTTPLWWIGTGLTLGGLGLGLSGAAMQTSALEAFSADLSGVAAGLYSTMRYLGSTLGTALIAIALAGDSSNIAGYERAFSWMVIAASGAVIVAWGLPKRRVAHEE
jgi:EmrB/QacA subfamily drug resistance transporter